MSELVGLWMALCVEAHDSNPFPPARQSPRAQQISPRRSRSPPAQRPARACVLECGAAAPRRRLCPWRTPFRMTAGFSTKPPPRSLHVSVSSRRRRQAKRRTPAGRCPGGTSEISRWCSEERAQPPDSPQKRTRPGGALETARAAPSHRPCRGGFGLIQDPVVLARGLAAPPANFRSASGAFLLPHFCSLSNSLLSGSPRPALP